MSYVETLLIETLVSDVSASKVFSFPRIGLYVDGVLNAHRLDSMEEAERRWALPTEGADQDTLPAELGYLPVIQDGTETLELLEGGEEAGHKKARSICARPGQEKRPAPPAAVASFRQECVI